MSYFSDVWNGLSYLLGNLSIDGLVGFLGILVALLVPITILIFEQVGHDGTGDFFPWEKSILIKHIAKAPVMFGAICMASLSLILWTINCNVFLRITLLALYLLSCTVIFVLLSRLYRWFSAITKITNRETYRQTVKFKFLAGLKTDEDRLNIWASTWSNMKPTNPHQVKYLEIYLKTINKISDNINSWSFISTLTQNLSNINIQRQEVQKLIINNSLGAYKQRSNGSGIDRHKNILFESLIEKLLIDANGYSDISTTFLLIDEFLDKEYKKDQDQAGIILNSFVRVLLSKIDSLSKGPDAIRKTLDYIPTEWYFNSLLNDDQNRGEKINRQHSKAYAVLWAYYEWFREKYSSRRNGGTNKTKVDRQIDAVTSGILGEIYHEVINRKMFGDLLSFYGNNGWVRSTNESLEHVFVRLFMEDSREFMEFNSCVVSDFYDPNESEEDRDKRLYKAMTKKDTSNKDTTIAVARYILGYINNDKHISDTLVAIEKYGSEISDESEEKAKLDELRETFKFIEKKNKQRNRKVK